MPFAFAFWVSFLLPTMTLSSLFPSWKQLASETSSRPRPQSWSGGLTSLDSAATEPSSPNARNTLEEITITKRKGSRLHEPQTVKRNLDTMQVAGFVLNEWNETPAHFRPAEICVDVIGIGSGVVDRLMEMGLPVVAVNVGEAPAMNDKFLNLRAELWFRGKDWFEKRNASLELADSRLIDELAMVRYAFTSNGKIKVESKDELKKRTRDRSSPDLADSFLLTLAGQHGMYVAAGTSGNGYAYGNKSVRRGRAALV